MKLIFYSQFAFFEQPLQVVYGSVCNYCSGVSSDVDFEHHFPLLLRGYSFKLSESTCTCGEFIRNIKRSVVKYQKEKIAVAPIEHDEEESWIYDLGWNVKQARRMDFRSRRNKRPKRRKNPQKRPIRTTKRVPVLRPESGSDLDDSSVASGFSSFSLDDSVLDGLNIRSVLQYASQMYLVYKDQSLISVGLVILNVIQDFELYDVYTYIKEWMHTYEKTMVDFKLDDMVEFASLASTNWARFQSHALYGALVSLLDLLLVLVFTPSKFVGEAMSQFSVLKERFEANRQDTSSFLSGLFKNSAAVLTSAKIYNDTKSVSQAFCIRSPLQQVYDSLGDVTSLYVKTAQGNVFEEEQNFLEKCSEEIDRIDKISPFLRFGDDKTAGWAQLRIKAMSNEVSSRLSGDEHRIQPYAFALIGGSGVGKTNMTVALMESILRANKIHSKIATLNLTDRFLSSVLSDTTGYMVDDPDFFLPTGTKPNKGMTFAELVFRVCGNAQWNIEKAEIELKGKVTCNCMVMGVSSNDWSLGLQDEVKEVGAAYRRFRCFLEFNLKPEYILPNADGSKSTMMDVDKVKQDHGTSRFPDIFTVTVKKAELKPNGVERFKSTFDYSRTIHQCDLYRFVPVIHNGMEMVNLSIQDLVSFLQADSREWFDSQRQVLKLRDNAIEYCEYCGLPEEICRCCSDTDIQPNSGGEPLEVEPSTSRVLAPFSPCQDCRADPFMSDSTGTICRKCLAVTRVCCAVHAEVLPPMKKSPKWLLESSSLCLICHPRTEDEDESEDLEGYDTDEAYESQWRGGLHPEGGVGFNPFLFEKQLFDTIKTNFQDVLTQHIVKGKVNIVGLMGNIDSLVSSELLDFLNYGMNCALDYALVHNIFDIQDWLPMEYEGTPFGTYYHARFGNAQFHKDCQLVLKYTGVCSIVGGVMAASSGLFCLASGMAAIAASSLYGYWHYDVGRMNSLYTNAKRDLRVLLKQASKPRYHKPIIKIGVFMLMSMISIFYTNYGLRFTFIAGLGLCANLDHQRDDDLYEIAGAISRSRMGRPQDWRGDLFKLCVSSTLAKKLYETSKSLVNVIWYNVGIVPQGGVTSAEDYDKLSAGDKFWFKRGWENMNLDPIPSTKLCQNKDICAAVENNVVFVRNETAGTICGGVYLCSKLLLLPKHFVSIEKSHYRVLRKPSHLASCTNHTTKFVMKRKDFRQVGPDLLVGNISKSTEHVDISGYFPLKIDRLPVLGYFMKRNPLGFIEIEGVSGIDGPKKLTNNFRDGSSLVYFEGMTYHTAGVGPGTCMAVLLSAENPSCILGFHLGAWSGTQCGVGCVLTQSDVEAAKRAYDSSISYSPAASVGDMPQQMYGVNAIIPGLHPNSVMSQYEEGGEFKVFGSISTISKDSHDIVETPIAEKVRSVMGCETKWGPPLLKHPTLGRKEKWFASLRKTTSTVDHIDMDLMDLAVADYVAPLLERADDFHIKRKLSQREVVNGIPGERMMEGMKMSTAVGFPLSGVKGKYFDLCVDPTTGNAYYEFNTDMFIKMANKYKVAYRGGKRCYPVFKTFPKIEPTKEGKLKVRLVNAAPLAYQLVSREYLLPIYAFLSFFSFLSECAVGVNPESLQWNEIYLYLTRHGKARLIALDYSSYDLTLPAQATFAASKVLQLIAQKWGWSADDIAIIIGLTTDIAWPVVSYNGDIVMLYGTTVSGHNGTVYFNSIVNSLLLRVAFFSIYTGGYVEGWWQKKKSDFRGTCVALTYGDDLVVGTKAARFTARKVAETLGKFGFVLTDSHKSAKIAKYENISSIEFLKRKFVYVKEFKTYVANLNEDSIFKRLCCVHRPVSPNNMALLLSTNLDSALHEWFYYGRKTYEKRRAQAKEVCSGLDDCTRLLCEVALSKTFDSRMESWSQKYLAVAES